MRPQGKLKVAVRLTVFFFQVQEILTGASPCESAQPVCFQSLDNGIPFAWSSQCDHRSPPVNLSAKNHR